MARRLYRVFVDETGDRGNSATSSPFFSMVAVAIRDDHMQQLHDAKREINLALGKPAAMELHWAKNLKGHDARLEAVERIAQLPIRISCITLEKAAAPAHSHVLHRDGMYNYPARLLLERLSWLIDDADGEALLTFASVKGMPAHILRDYVALLRTRPHGHGPDQTTIRWNAIRHPIHIEQAIRRDGIQIADVVGGALDRAIRPSPNPPHRTEPRYLNELGGVLYRGTTNKLASYGLKALARPGFWQSFPWWPALAKKP